MDFSLIIPSYNEAHNLPDFLSSATACLDGADIDYELIFVNDGSSDETSHTLHRIIDEYRASAAGGLAHSRASIVVVELSRNFGKESAMFAGLERCTGDCVGFIDADMQQDPEVALQMFRILQDETEVDCVAAVPERRRESLPLRVCKRFFYRAFNGMSETRVVADVSDFRVFRRPVADALLSMREQFRFSKGLFAWVGFSTKVIPYEVHERHSGKSKWSLRKLISYAWNGVLAFSTWPLKVIMYLGLILMVVSLGMFVWDLFDQVSNPESILSVGRLLTYVVLLMSGIQMVVMGVIGEYMARAYIEAKNRPIYLARREYASRPGRGADGAQAASRAKGQAEQEPQRDR